MIPELDAAALRARDAGALAVLGEAAMGIGFFTVRGTALTAARVEEVLETYGRFFCQPEAAKRALDMSRTGANRGWGAPGSEQVDPDANPDYRQFFDVGYEVSDDNPLAQHRFYAKNLWPDDPAFRTVISAYYTDACAVAYDLLQAIAHSIGAAPDHFHDAFDAPMALLRGNYYPARPLWAGAKDFGIATHTDYGCLTLLATDGAPGLEVRQRGGGWIPLSAPPGTFIVNFGEMLEIWTAGKVKATPHRVVGGAQERLSVPLFFNPTYDVNVAPAGASPVLAGDHLSARFEETYVHLGEIS